MSKVNGQLVTCDRCGKTIFRKDSEEIRNLLYTGFYKQESPFCIRYERDSLEFNKSEFKELPVGTWEYLQKIKGCKSTVISYGTDVAKLYDLEILETNINESRNNTTRFAVFSKSLNTSKSVNKMGEHFILVFTVLNEAGALAKTLNIIGSYGFNMRTLRSRPMKELQWNYYFFVEADGDINSSDGQEMIRQLKTVCDRLKIVGTYYNQVER